MDKTNRLASDFSVRLLKIYKRQRINRLRQTHRHLFDEFRRRRLIRHHFRLATGRLAARRSSAIRATLRPGH